MTKSPDSGEGPIGRCDDSPREAERTPCKRIGFRLATMTGNRH